MNNRKLEQARIKNFSPREAWDHYVTLTPEKFISGFYYNNPPVRDLRQMCRIFSLEIPSGPILYTNKDLSRIESLIYSYLIGYIDDKGGLDQLDLYSEEELDRLDAIELEEFLALHGRAKVEND